MPNKIKDIAFIFLFIVSVVLSAINARAQISIKNIEKYEASIFPDPQQIRENKELRNQIVQAPETLSSLIYPKIHPFDRDGINLEEYIKDIVSWSPSITGCGKTGDIVGFYSPLDHLWIFVELDKNQQITDAAITIGFQANHKNGTSWLALTKETGGALKALHAATVIQFGAFATFFNDANCSPLSNAKHVSHSAAVEQIRMLNEDVRRPDFSLNKAFLHDLEKETDSELAQWSMRYRITLDDDWFVFFTSPDFAGMLLIAHWQVKPEEEYAYFQNATLLPLIRKQGGDE